MQEEEENSPESQGGTEVISNEEEKVNNRILNKLNQLKEDLEKNQSNIQDDQIELDTLKKETEILKGNITELEKSGDDIDEVVNEYGKAYYDIGDKKTELKVYYDYKQPPIFDALTQNMKQKIDEKRTDVDENTIVTYKKRVEDLKDKITKEEGNKAKDKKELLELLFKEGKKGINVQRYKGLGEMNPDQLWHTTMNPEKRTLLQVRVDDMVDTDEIFTILMGEEVEPRREFIQNNALEVNTLDI